MRYGAPWARELKKLGHDARLMPPTYVISWNYFATEA